MRTHKRAGLIAASGMAVIAFASACGSSTSHPAATSPPTPSSSAQTVLQAADSSSLGRIVTDTSGLTLYRFDNDTASPSKSNCNGSCAKLWLPVPAQGSPTLKGIDKALVGTVTRSDGSRQITLNGWPLYRYSLDAKAGDTKGEGIGGVWFASTPTGDKAMPQSQTPAPGPTPGPSGGSSGGGGYGY